MDITSKKGYTLMLAVLSLIILTVIGFGLYAFVEHFAKESKLQETGHIKGYYAALSGLRYARAELLKDPQALFGGQEPVVGSIITKSLWNDYNTLATDIGLSTYHDVTLVIEKIGADAFKVSATYNY